MFGKYGSAYSYSIGKTNQPWITFKRNNEDDPDLPVCNATVTRNVVKWSMDA
jgi:hypothetical protein